VPECGLRVFGKGLYRMGYKTVEFEEAWKKYTDHKNAYYLNSNTVGLYLAVKILKMNNGWQDEDEFDEDLCRN